MIQQLDFSTIFLNLITGLPWWVYPILFIAVFLKNYKPKKKTKLKYEFKENKKAVKVEKSTNTLSNEEKKIKGDEYEKFVAEHFRKEGYYVWEHGQEKGKQDGGIDLFIKKGKDTYFVQCKNWENWKINHDTVQAVQTKVRNYMTENPNLTKLLNGNSKKILYVMPKPLLTKSAYAYIKTQPEILDFRIIPMP